MRVCARTTRTNLQVLNDIRLGVGSDLLENTVEGNLLPALRHRRRRSKKRKVSPFKMLYAAVFQMRVRERLVIEGSLVFEIKTGATFWGEGAIGRFSLQNTR